MSAESSCTPSQLGGHVIAPQPVSDRSIIESVAGFINDVVPQGYTSVGPISENKEQITWARFEFGDINDPALYPDTSDDRNGTAPLLLVLGYGNGVQVWSIPASGEAMEVLSWRQGVVRTLRVLPTPPPPADPLMQQDLFAHKRPLVAICDSTAPGPQFCALSFISLRGGDQVKSIKFKNSVNDVLANRTSVVVSFHERIAVFDASTLEDRMTITTCYPCPGPNPNPVALGARWMAYAERRLIPGKRCSGGTEGEGIQSYTATVLHAAKSLGKGLRELGETVASSLTGGVTPPGSRTISSAMVGQSDAEVLHPGIVTIVDAQGTWKENGRMEDNVVAHFTAHTEAILALQFDPSGMLLVTADKRGHDFHVFRIQPHPGGSPLAAVHHLYVLHRGDTTAKVQDIAFAGDSRWVAVSTLRGTTHVFPITPYGGAVGLRTHSTPHVVNRLSRFHRSAGLTGDGRNSPQPVPQQPPQPPQAECQSSSQAAMPYPNPRLPPYPHPTVVVPLAQIRQPFMHLAAPSSPNPANHTAGYHRNPSVKALGRNQSSSEESSGIPLQVSACFAPSRAWLVGSPTMARDSSARTNKKAVDSLFVMACHGNLIEYDLETKHATGIPKEKVCDDSPIELEVVAKAQWLLLRPPQSCQVQPPLPHSNPLMVIPAGLGPSCHSRDSGLADVGSVSADERWLSHVEIVTHAGPHRRLWMGPQFTFKTYTASASVGVSLLEAECVDISVGSRLARSNPVNMPLSNTARQNSSIPFLIESGSGGSLDQSPHLLEVYGAPRDGNAGPGETQLREELADAMMESPGVPTRDTGRRVIVELQDGKRGQGGVPIEKIVNPVGTVLTVLTDEGVSDGRALDGEPIDMTVRWPTDVIKVTPKLSQVHVTKKCATVLPPTCKGDLEVDVTKKRGKMMTAPPVEECLDRVEVLTTKKRGKMMTAPPVEECLDRVEVPTTKKRGKPAVQDAKQEDGVAAGKLAASKAGTETSSKRRENVRRVAAKESKDDVIQDDNKSNTKEKVLPICVPADDGEAIPNQEHEMKEMKKKDLSKGNGVRDVKSQEKSCGGSEADARKTCTETQQVCTSEKEPDVSQESEVCVSEKKRYNRLNKVTRLSTGSNAEHHLIGAQEESLVSSGQVSPDTSSLTGVRSPLDTSAEVLSDQSFYPADVVCISIDQEDSFESVAESLGDCMEMENAYVDSSAEMPLPNASSAASVWINTMLEPEPTLWQDASYEETVVPKSSERADSSSRVANGNALKQELLTNKVQSKRDKTSVASKVLATSTTLGQKAAKGRDDVCDVAVKTECLSAEEEPVAVAQVDSVSDIQVSSLKRGVKSKSAQSKDGRKSKAHSPEESVADVPVADSVPQSKGSLETNMEISSEEITKPIPGKRLKRNEAKPCPSTVSAELVAAAQCSQAETAVNSNASLPTVESRAFANSSASKNIFEPFVKAEDAVSNYGGYPTMQEATSVGIPPLDIDGEVFRQDIDQGYEENNQSLPNAWGSKPRMSLKKRLSNLPIDDSKASALNDDAIQIPAHKIEEASTISHLECVRLSPPKSWSSIASGKNKCEKQPSEEQDGEGLVPPDMPSNPPETSMPPLVATLYTAAPASGESQAVNDTGVCVITDTTQSCSERLIHGETEEDGSNESEIQSSLQASKKNRKKNKKRR